MPSSVEVKAGRTALPRLELTDGGVETLKWFGLAAMTLDHANKFLLGTSVPALFALGRLVLPLFVIVLAYNLARPGADRPGRYRRTMRRLAWVAVLASLPFMALGGLVGGWWPLNVMFTLLLIAAALQQLDQSGTLRVAAAAGVVAISGGLVEYWWPAVALGICTWAYCRRPSWVAAVGAVLSCAALSPLVALVSGQDADAWALLALPLVLVVGRLQLALPRFPLAFYAYYPAHLIAIWIARALTTLAGV